MATSAEDMGERLVDSSFDDKSDEELNRQQQTMSFYEEALKNESFQKKRELLEHLQELLDINSSKAHIARRRYALTAVKADPADFELLSQKLTEWIELSEKEAIDNDIAMKWENIIEGYRLSATRWGGLCAARESSAINPIVRQYRTLKNFVSPMLNSYKGKAEDVQTVRRKTM
jgi:hypothetical protein